MLHSILKVRTTHRNVYQVKRAAKRKKKVKENSVYNYIAEFSST